MSEKRVCELSERLLAEGVRMEVRRKGQPYFTLVREMKDFQSAPGAGRIGPQHRHQARRSPVPNHRAHGPQMAAPLSAARSARLDRTLPRASSPAQENFRGSADIVVETVLAGRGRPRQTRNEKGRTGMSDPHKQKGGQECPPRMVSNSAEAIPSLLYLPARRRRLRRRPSAGL